MACKAWLFVAAALTIAQPALAQTPADGGWRGALARLRQARQAPPARAPGKSKAVGLAALLSGRPAHVRAAAAVTVAETEPNDSSTTADSTGLSDQATGYIDPAGDADYWSFHATAGQFVTIDVDAAQLGSPLDPTLELLGSDGVTSLAFNDDFDGLDSQLSYQIQTSGVYYAVIRGFAASGGTGDKYAINFSSVTCAVVGTENEPNGAFGTARAVSLGTDGTGEICPSSDVDYWSFPAAAGTVVELDIDASQFGSSLDPVMALFTSDGAGLAFNDDFDGLDSRIDYTVTAAGTYYVGVGTFGLGGPGYTYTLHFRTVPPGPGDPVAVRAQNLGFPVGLAVNRDGLLFTGDLFSDTIRRVSPQGNVSVFAIGVPGPEGMAWDAGGNLLVAAGDGDVYSITPQGQPNRFITDPEFPFWIAVGQDGTVWLTDLSDGSIRQYSAQGQRMGTYDVSVVGEYGPGPIAIAPSGEPYFSNGPAIWKLVNGQPQKVFDAAFTVWGFAFDVTGNIYVPNPSTGRITLYGPTGAVLADPFVLGVGSPRAVAFGRDADGRTNARLFATDAELGALIEVNPAGVQHPGLPLGFPLQMTAAAAAADLLGGGGLSDGQRQSLDSLGNRNGRYDAGDFRAYLILTGGLPAAAAPAVARRPDRSDP